ncbi:MAG: Tad domain-containing protein [Bryobacteraceae bacterium]
MNDFLELIHMVKKTRSRRGQRGNILVFLTLALPFFVGLVGLGIDATMCYIVQTELSAAVDGAALGAGRLISSYNNSSSDTDIANEFLNANFRVGQDGFWGSYNLTPTITVTTGITKTVTVTATANVPLLFMRLLHQNAATVGATATATRRDARIEFVIDRSGSMNQVASDGNTAIYDVLQKAESFTEQFTSCPATSCTTPLNYDELGLVAFSGSAVVGYPTYTTTSGATWPASVSPTAVGGPDIYFYNGATTDMVHQLAAIQANDGTAMGDGLALAYIELQKAHVADMAANNGVDSRVNAIVLFTDGVPSSVVTYPNQNSNSVISHFSGCTYAVDTATPSHPIYGYVVVTGSPPYSSQSTLAYYQLGSLDTTSSHTSNWYMQNPSYDMSVSAPSLIPSSGFAGCTGSSGWSNLSNLSAIPSFDKYGYPLTANMTGGVAGYKLSQIIGDSSATSIYESSHGDFNTTDPTKAYQWGLAGWDEVDNVAQAIRSDSNYANRGETSPVPITIYTIGYTGNGGTDSGLLQKIANVAACNVNGYACSVSGQQQGIYAQASNADEISNAFNIILTAILRLKN